MTMRLGLLGGTFDPVHYGHLLLAESAREQCKLDRVWFLPTATPPHKQGIRPTPAEQRIEMLELAIAGNEAFGVSRYEVDRGGVSYTVQTLRHYREEVPEAELYFLMGADMLHDLPRWREASAVCELALPVAVQRAGEAPLDFSVLSSITFPERIDVISGCHVEMPGIGISGTDIRQRVALGRSIRYLLPRAVEKYIETHGLYR